VPATLVVEPSTPTQSPSVALSQVRGGMGCVLCCVSKCVSEMVLLSRHVSRPAGSDADCNV